MWFNSKYETNTSTCWCLNDSPGNGRWACPRFLGRAFIYLFVDLFTFPRLDGGSDLLSEACREAALDECRTKVDAGRRSNQQRDLEQDIHMDYTRVFGKWAIKQRAELNAGG